MIQSRDKIENNFNQNLEEADSISEFVAQEFKIKNQELTQKIQETELLAKSQVS